MLCIFVEFGHTIIISWFSLLVQRLQVETYYVCKMVSEPIQDPLDHLLLGFRYRTTWVTLQMFSSGFEGVC